MFKSIKKQLNLELAVAIVQDLLSNGPERAKRIELKVVKLASNGKKVTIADEFASVGDKPLSQDDIPGIDEAIIRLSDKSGDSPSKRIALGASHGPPFRPEEVQDGYFTPNRKARRSLATDLEVGKRLIA